MTKSKLNFTVEVGQLLDFVSRVATAIRTNSPYSGGYDNRDPQHGEDVMWLADSLHSLSGLGRALQGTDAEAIVKASEGLLKSYQTYERIDTGFKSEPKLTFEKYENSFTVNEAIVILSEIRDKAKQIASS